MVIWLLRPYLYQHITRLKFHNISENSFPYNSFKYFWFNWKYAYWSIIFFLVLVGYISLSGISFPEMISSLNYNRPKPIAVKTLGYYWKHHFYVLFYVGNFLTVMIFFTLLYFSIFQSTSFIHNSLRSMFEDLIAFSKNKLLF